MVEAWAFRPSKKSPISNGLQPKGSRPWATPRLGCRKKNRAEKKEGALAWDRAPPKVAFRWSGLGVTGPGVIHPSFPLRGRWERPVPSRELGPFLPIHATGGSLERDPRRVLCTSSAHSIDRAISPRSFIFNSLCTFFPQRRGPRQLRRINSGSAPLTKSRNGTPPRRCPRQPTPASPPHCAPARSAA